MAAPVYLLLHIFFLFVFNKILEGWIQPLASDVTSFSFLAPFLGITHWQSLITLFPPPSILIAPHFLNYISALAANDLTTWPTFYFWYRSQDWNKHAGKRVWGPPQGGQSAEPVLPPSALAVLGSKWYGKIRKTLASWLHSQSPKLAADILCICVSTVRTILAPLAYIWRMFPKQPPSACKYNATYTQSFFNNVRIKDDNYLPCHLLERALF